MKVPSHLRTCYDDGTFVPTLNITKVQDTLLRARPHHQRPKTHLLPHPPDENRQLRRKQQQDARQNLRRSRTPRSPRRLRSVHRATRRHTRTPHAHQRQDPRLHHRKGRRRPRVRRLHHGHCPQLHPRRHQAHPSPTQPRTRQHPRRRRHQDLRGQKDSRVPPRTAGQQQDHHHRHRMHWALQQKRSRMVRRHRETPSRTPTPAAPPRPEHHQRARHIRPRGHQEVPLQRRRNTTRAPQTKHGVVHRNHRKSTPQTRRRRARVRRETGHDLGLNTNPKSPV
ncbi:hypothetical protein MICPUN_104710 [Micromonas commoda]|uniref:Uncharacterized protein n=1 Tax=Micromonas commoda (strain RCC299 / NOUM17 / CCMP2709) TaxID=296587 RepID=C1FDH1_MICCC|nr:hypothetical protein MICPUN_104710 [Micromonas commoda]ACO68786.1 hypothetical protein MICPUN_104710 [Micromonas commoda]|eukprot:XP_002507528.1 hypothetical protein MICPUN_104710 [Micromonas commoda]